jgi:hypothetical protein
MTRFFLTVVFSLSMSACATPSNVAGRSTVNLTSSGVAALHAVEVVKILDVIRDTAVDGAAAQLIPTHTARSVVTWHQAALKTIASVPNGWKATVLSGLVALKATFSDAERNIIGPYIDSAIVMINTVIS